MHDNAIFQIEQHYVIKIEFYLLNISKSITMSIMSTNFIVKKYFLFIALTKRKHIHEKHYSHIVMLLFKTVIVT